MIEEAAGTSLYEKKREQTTAVIEKKDSKLKEMDSVSEFWGKLSRAAIDGLILISNVAAAQRRGAATH